MGEILPPIVISEIRLVVAPSGNIGLLEIFGKGLRTTRTEGIKEWLANRMHTYH
jgi:hypothetical protein